MHIAAVAYDPYQFHDVAITAASEGFPMVEFPQGARRILADTALRAAILAGRLGHTHHPALQSAVESADLREDKGRDGDGKGVRIVKGSGKVDPLVALSMALWTMTAGDVDDKPPPMPEGLGVGDIMSSASMDAWAEDGFDIEEIGTGYKGVTDQYGTGFAGSGGKN
jgi:phage terminase large subunit-like protein